MVLKMIGLQKYKGSPSSFQNNYHLACNELSAVVGILLCKYTFQGLENTFLKDRVINKYQNNYFSICTNMKTLYGGKYW